MSSSMAAMREDWKEEGEAKVARSCAAAAGEKPRATWVGFGFGFRVRVRVRLRVRVRVRSRVPPRGEGCSCGRSRPGTW